MRMRRELLTIKGDRKRFELTLRALGNADEHLVKVLARHIRKLERKLKLRGGGYMDTEVLIEAIKEGLRVAVLSVIPVAILQLQNGNFDYRALIIVGLISLLRFIDSWLHKSGTAEKGLTRF